MITLTKVNVEMGNAAKYTANEKEKEMLKCYIRSYQECSLDELDNALSHWMKNKGPAVETQIGLLSTYRDPVGMRGEFTGFVGMINHEQSHTFKKLVNKAKKLLPLLPCHKDFEKDTFSKPDFTSIDVLTSAGSSIPTGFNFTGYRVNLVNSAGTPQGTSPKGNFYSQPGYKGVNTTLTLLGSAASYGYNTFNTLPTPTSNGWSNTWTVNNTLNFGVIMCYKNPWSLSEFNRGGYIEFSLI